MIRPIVFAIHPMVDVHIGLLFKQSYDFIAASLGVRIIAFHFF